MPTCKNDPSKKYKGTEPSPKGMGWCAHGEKEGKVRKGKDGNQWIVKKVKNGSKRWIKKDTSKKLSNKSKMGYTKSMKLTDNYDFIPIKRLDCKTWTKDISSSQLKTFNKLTKDAIKDINKLGIKVFIVPVPISDQGFYFTDYPWDYVSEKYNNNNNYLDNQFIIIVLKIDKQKRLELTDGGLYIQHNLLKKNSRLLDDLMKKSFKSKYKWNLSASKAIFLKM